MLVLFPLRLDQNTVVIYMLFRTKRIKILTNKLRCTVTGFDIKFWNIGSCLILYVRLSYSLISQLEYIIIKRKLTCCRFWKWKVWQKSANWFTKRNWKEHSLFIFSIFSDCSLRRRLKGKQTNKAEDLDPSQYLQNAYLWGSFFKKTLIFCFFCLL